MKWVTNYGGKCKSSRFHESSPHRAGDKGGGRKAGRQEVHDLSTLGGHTHTHILSRINSVPGRSAGHPRGIRTAGGRYCSRKRGWRIEEHDRESFRDPIWLFFLPSSSVDSREREWMRRRAEEEKEEEEAGLICTFAQTQSTGQ